ncbi:hypothetical protein WICPIJ_001150 [Wickerhamomyces pijperi]|uniref:Uncharacterized protein n=1 Tax=Wickerhamomyces pijperi TaxID=599730 RepID=A0A9P8QB96_WICPI|nr:hypothetical protein WICPIJ_001150 [Wickerhamomyces pijperi]
MSLTPRCEPYLEAEGYKHPRIINYKDPNLHTANVSNEGRIFLREAAKQYNKIYKSINEAGTIVPIQVGVRHGRMTFEMANSAMRLVDDKAIRQTGKKFPSIFCSNDIKYYSWLGPPLHKDIVPSGIEPHYPLNLNSDKPNDQTTNKRNYFEQMMNRLIQEEEEYGMCFKVYICRQCESGTSYCAKKLKREDGIWCCNNCKYINYCKDNQYYIYNKFETTLHSVLNLSAFDAKKQSEIQNKSKLPAKPMSQFDEKKTKIDRTHHIIRGRDFKQFYNSPYMLNARTSKLTSDKYGSKSVKESEEDQCYYNTPTVDIVVNCDEIQGTNTTASMGQSFYCFYITFCDLLGENQEKTTHRHRSMIIPKIENQRSQFDFSLDELLAPLNDDLDRLINQGFRYTSLNAGSQDSELLKVAVFNFSAEPQIVSKIKANVGSWKHLTNHEGVVIPDFFHITFKHFFKLLSTLTLSLISDAEKAHFAREIRHSTSEALKFGVPAHGVLTYEDLISVDRDLTNEKGLHATKVFADEINFSRLKSVPKELPQLFVLLNKISVAFVAALIESEGPVTDVNFLYNCESDCHLFARYYCALSVKYPQLKSECLDDFTRLSAYANYFGYIAAAHKLTVSVNKIDRIIKERYDLSCHYNVLHALNKADVVFENMIEVQGKIVRDQAMKGKMTFY